MSFKHTVTMTLAATASAASLSAIAVPLTVGVSGITGSAIIWSSNSCPAGKVCPDYSPTVSEAQAVLDGIGNVELNQFGATPATTMTGTFGVGGPTITLSSLVLADWTANSDALAIAYITDAAASAGLNIAPALSAALVAFYAPNATLGGLAPWMLVSDPNISYANNDGGVVHIGLDGLIDASVFLNALNPAAPDQGAQVSEVVKVTYNGETDYLYGFHATPTGYRSNDNTYSYTGNYEVTVPEPAALWLLGIGLVGLVVSRRR